MNKNDEENKNIEERVEGEKERGLPEELYIYNRPKKEKPKKSKFKGSMTSYIAVALIASILGGISSSYIGRLNGGDLLGSKTLEYNAKPVNINTKDDINTVSAVAQKAMKSVVGITTVEVQEHLFTQREVEGIGSGVIVDPNGYILTNAHVVGGGNAKSINVLFETGDKLPAQVLWNDNSLDLAVIKVDAVGLPAAELGDSDDLNVGEISVAIGNPLGLEFQRTVTSGIISGLNRSVAVNKNDIIENLIQTDASINFGNSGGPLLNGKGQVIGVNTAKVESAEGLGFSIPINDIKPILTEVLSSGSYKMVFMGVSGLGVEEYKARLGVDFDIKKGIVLIEISENSPASQAGLLNGDIITKIDDVELESMAQLKKSLYKYKKGDKVILTVISNNEEKQVEIKFTEIR